MKLTAICIFGIESVLSREIRNLGLEILETGNGRVDFEGGIKEAAMANMWLRTAERVYIKAASFDAYTFDMLFDNVKSVDWSELIPADGKISVSSSNINSKLHSGRDCQRIVKKAAADKLCAKYGLDMLPETGPEFRIEVFIKNDKAELYIDTTGTGLHKRGYRKLNVEAPLKETIAAALLLLSYWRPGRLLMDPFCGSGTFPIEAAMISANIAPGLKRDFSFALWNDENRSILEELRKDAETRIIDTGEVKIFGSDISAGNIRIAGKHAADAGVKDRIKFRVSDALEAQSPGEYGVMVCNPPYGMRISDKSEVSELYKGMGEMFRRFETWSKYVLTDAYDFEKLSGIKASKRRKIYNGTISCTFYQYFGPKPG